SNETALGSDVGSVGLDVDEVAAGSVAVTPMVVAEPVGWPSEPVVVTGDDDVVFSRTRRAVTGVGDLPPTFLLTASTEVVDDDSEPAAVTGLSNLESSFSPSDVSASASARGSFFLSIDRGSMFTTRGCRVSVLRV
ncbi:MAG: hypothetical protein OER95_15210, partial [Acidimicrobiia bacterium]|nr:hypothetical protein [Acidimicrobiia bacterium]